MLVLSRKPGQRILIGEDVEVQVVATRAGRVKLGITAPSDVRVRRGELPSFDDALHTAEKASRPLAGALSDSRNIATERPRDESSSLVRTDGFGYLDQT